MSTKTSLPNKETLLTHNETTPTKARTVFFVLAPVFLIFLLTAGIRFVSESTKQEEAVAEAKTEQDWLVAHNRSGSVKNHPKRMPALPPPHAADKVTQAALEMVVRGQMDAIGSQDYKKALTFSASGMRRGMPPDQFERMIRRGYASMLETRKITFSPAQVRATIGKSQEAFIPVKIITRSGNVASYGFMLGNEASGWVVEGVVPQQIPFTPGEDAPITAPRLAESPTLEK